MSEENVEIVRKAIEAVSAREVPEDLIAPDARIQNVATAVSDNLYVGHDGVREWQEDFFGVMDEGARLEVEEVIAVGEDCVVVMLRLAGHGAQSGAPLSCAGRQPSGFAGAGSSGRRGMRAEGRPSKPSGLRSRRGESRYALLAAATCTRRAGSASR
jgi:hypothetical protein